MSDDLIRRSDAIEMLQEAIMAYPPVMKGCGETRDSTLEEAINLILDTPSADRPQGEWKSVKASIYPYGYDVECSVCGHRMGSSFGYKFCPMCGASMKGADNEMR